MLSLIGWKCRRCTGTRSTRRSGVRPLIPSWCHRPSAPCVWTCCVSIAHITKNKTKKRDFRSLDRDSADGPVYRNGVALRAKSVAHRKRFVFRFYTWFYIIQLWGYIRLCRPYNAKCIIISVNSNVVYTVNNSQCFVLYKQPQHKHHAFGRQWC